MRASTNPCSVCKCLTDAVALIFGRRRCSEELENEDTELATFKTSLRRQGAKQLSVDTQVDMCEDGKSVEPCEAETEPSKEDTIRWQEVHPQGGKLLRVQVCAAAGGEDPPEWCSGRLFTGEGGIYFEEGDDGVIWGSVRERLSEVLRFDEMRSVKLFTSQRTIDVEEEGLKSYDVLLELSDKAKASQASALLTGGALKLALSFVDAEFIHYHWNNYESLPPSKTAPSTAERMSKINHRRHSRETTFAGRISLASQHAGGRKSLASQQAGGRMSHASQQTQPSCLSDSFYGVTDGLPGLSTNFVKGPVFCTEIPRTNLNDIYELLSAEKWFIDSYFSEVMGASEIKCTPWVAAIRVTGTRVRRTQFRAPLLMERVPKSLRALIRLPQSALATFVFRLGRQEDQIVLVQQGFCCGFPYASSFRLQETYVFSPSEDESDEVVMQKFVDVIWVQSIPMSLRPLKIFVERFLLDDAKRLGGDFSSRVFECTRQMRTARRRRSLFRGMTMMKHGLSRILSAA